MTPYWILCTPVERTLEASIAPLSSLKPYTLFPSSLAKTEHTWRNLLHLAPDITSLQSSFAEQQNRARTLPLVPEENVLSIDLACCMRDRWCSLEESNAHPFVWHPPLSSYAKEGPHQPSLRYHFLTFCAAAPDCASPFFAIFSALLSHSSLSFFFKATVSPLGYKALSDGSQEAHGFAYTPSLLQSILTKYSFSPGAFIDNQRVRRYRRTTWPNDSLGIFSKYSSWRTP